MSRYIISHELLVAAAPILLALTIFGLPQRASASPTATDDASGDGLETITVTARKVAENLLKVPVAVQVLTAKDLDARNVVSFDDLALYTPGLTDDQSSAQGARADRSFQQFIIRGMNPSNVNNPTTSIFINGVPIPSALLQNVGDADRVEVLEGPQSAYFGKDTFAGAINVVSKTPPKELGGYLSVEQGTRQTENYKFSLGGPLIDDKVSFLGSFDYNSHEGSYKNAANPGQYLGDQSTLTGDLTILIKPVENLTIKAYGLVLKEHDGPAATGILLADAAGGIPSQANCVVGGSPWFCGTLPRLPSTSPAQNDTNQTALGPFLATSGKVVNPPNDVDSFGLERKAFFDDVGIDYYIQPIGVTLTSLTGISRDEVSEVSDLSNLDGSAVGDVFGAPYTGFPFLTDDRDSTVSQEFRVSTDPDKPYRFLLGASYLDTRVTQGLGAPGAFGFYTNDGTTEDKTRGVFFSAAYDIIPQLTVDVEGRYQYDDVSLLAPVTDVRTDDAHFHNFLPRGIIQYKPTADVMTYFTYSEGVNTGSFNSQIAALPGATQSFFTSAPYDASIVVRPEKLKNFELGVKGSFLDGRATLVADVYYDKWSNQLVSRLFTIQPNSVDPPNPLGTLSDSVNWTDNSGRSTAKGFEVTGNIIPIEHLALNVSGAVNDTTYNQFSCLPCASYNPTLPVNTDGKELPNAPKFSATAGLQYSNMLDFLGVKDWFVRTDVIYRSGVYIDSLNEVKTPQTEIVNLRGGFNWEHVKVEGYVTNLFNNKAYTNGFPDYNFTGTFAHYDAVMVGLPQLITGGVRLKYNF